MSDTALQFEGVWKKFRKGEIFDSLRDLIPAVARGLFSRARAVELEEREFWALRGIDFRVGRGEAFGIIGSNGAGKSTTLKLLSRVLTPNRGRITAHGRISALIEVGAGFHPDLSGRDNVYLNGAILGMKRQEVARKFDEIVEFAGIGDFIDTPVKRYSSGMYARLGFAVAAHVEPEILVVDEVLSVGDMPFQEKCLERMRAVVRNGTTVIFVSHNLQAVQMLCPRALLLRSGSVAEIGSTRDVIAAYVSGPSDADAGSAAGAIVGNVRLEDRHGMVATDFVPGQPARLRFKLDAAVPLEGCVIAFIVQRLSDGQFLCDYNFKADSIAGQPGATAACVIDFDVNLLRGAYRVLLNIYNSSTASFLAYHASAGHFTVTETVSYAGVSHLKPELCAESAVETLRGRSTGCLA